MRKFILLLMLAILGCSDSNRTNKSEIVNSNEINTHKDLVVYLNESKYESNESYIKGEICNKNEQGDYDCYHTYGEWSLKFYETELHWAKYDYIAIATYSYLDHDAFLINLGNTSIIATIDTSAKKIEADGVVYELVPAE